MKNLAHSLAETLVKNNVIDTAKEKQCQYGLELMMTSLGEILFIIVVSVFFKNPLETLTFFASFIPLRIYAGGYHADTRLRCFLILVGVYVIFSVLLRTIPIELYQHIIYGAIVFNTIVILKLAPVVHSRKNMNEKEIKMFRKIALNICFFEVALIVLGNMLFKYNVYLLSFVFGQISVTISMVMADIKSKLIK